MGRGPRGTRRSHGHRVLQLLRLVLLLGLACGVSGEPGTDGECEAPGVWDTSHLASDGAESRRGVIAEAEQRAALRAAPLRDSGAWVEAAQLQLAPPGVGGDVGIGFGLGFLPGPGDRRAGWERVGGLAIGCPIFWSPWLLQDKFLTCSCSSPHPFHIFHFHEELNVKNAKKEV